MQISFAEGLFATAPPPLRPAVRSLQREQTALRLAADVLQLGGEYGGRVSLLIRAWLLLQRVSWQRYQLRTLPPASRVRRIAHFQACVLEQRAFALQAAGRGDTKAASLYQDDAAWFAEQIEQHRCVMLVA